MCNMIERQSLRLANLQVKQFCETILWNNLFHDNKVRQRLYVFSHVFQDQTSDMVPVYPWYTNGGFHVLNRNKYGEL